MAMLMPPLRRKARQTYGGKTGIAVHQQELPLHRLDTSSLAYLWLVVPSKCFERRKGEWIEPQGRSNPTHETASDWKPVTRGMARLGSL